MNRQLLLLILFAAVLIISGCDKGGDVDQDELPKSEMIGCYVDYQGNEISISREKIHLNGSIIYEGYLFTRSIKTGMPSVHAYPRRFLNQADGKLGFANIGEKADGVSIPVHMENEQMVLQMAELPEFKQRPFWRTRCQVPDEKNNDS